MQYPITLPAVSTYPVHAPLGLIGELLRVLSFGGFAPELVGPVLTFIVSLLTQGIADVEWPNGQKSPVGGSSLVVAPSGFGKSLIYKILIGPIERQLMELIQCDGTDNLSNFFLEDVNLEALLRSLSDWPISCIAAEEGVQFSAMLNNGELIAKLLDSSTIRSPRLSTGRVNLHWYRFCILLLLRPDVFESMKVKLGSGKGGVRVINRFFVSSLVGLVPKALHNAKLSESLLDAYETKIRKLLALSIKQAEQKSVLATLRLSPQAVQYLISLDSDVRRQNVPGASLDFISEYIARHIERVLRLAGAFHVFEYGVEGEITLDTLQRAAMIGHWHIEKYAQMVYEPPQPKKAELNAIKLEQQIVHLFHISGCSHHTLISMRTNALNIGLTAAEFNAALAVLRQQGRVNVYTQRNKAWFAYVFPPLQNRWLTNL